MMENEWYNAYRRAIRGSFRWYRLDIEARPMPSFLTSDLEQTYFSLGTYLSETSNTIRGIEQDILLYRSHRWFYSEKDSKIVCFAVRFDDYREGRTAKIDSQHHLFPRNTDRIDRAAAEAAAAAAAAGGYGHDIGENKEQTIRILVPSMLTPFVPKPSGWILLRNESLRNVIFSFSYRKFRYSFDYSMVLNGLVSPSNRKILLMVIG